MPRTITKDMLAKTLQRLEAIQANEPTELGDEQLLQRAEEVATAALAAIAICLKFSLASYGDATIDGFGTFVMQNGAIEFTPENDVLQYALLKHRDEASDQIALRDAFVRTLTLADSIIPLLDLTKGKTTSVKIEGRLMGEVFYDEVVLPSRLETAVSKILGDIVGHLSLAGIEISLPTERQEELPVTLPLSHVHTTREAIQEAMQKAMRARMARARFSRSVEEVSSETAEAEAE